MPKSPSVRNDMLKPKSGSFPRVAVADFRAGHRIGEALVIVGEASESPISTLVWKSYVPEPNTRQFS